MTEKKSSLQGLFDHVFKSGKTGTKSEADRQPEGTYTNGFRNDIKTATLEISGFAVQAVRTAYQQFNLGADTDGKRYGLKICKGSKVVLEATREGASTIKKFGAEERYIGTDTTPEGKWVVVKGKMPRKLETLPT